MRTVTDNSREELANTLAAEIAMARNEARPISRLTLSRLLQAKFSLNPHEAERFVDRYCEDKAPAIPTFLSSEFGTPYLKVLSVINIVLAIGLYVVAAISLGKPNVALWPWLLLGTVFLAAAVICWVQSLRPPKSTAIVRVTTLPNISTPNVDSREPATTGPSQPRS